MKMAFQEKSGRILSKDCSTTIQASRTYGGIVYHRQKSRLGPTAQKYLVEKVVLVPTSNNALISRKSRSLHV